MTPWSLALTLASGIRILVLPFENLSDNEAHDWRGSAFEESISSHMELAGHDVVGFGERNQRLGDRGFSPTDPVTRATAIVLARDLGAERLVMGSFQPTNEWMEVTARIVDLNEEATVGIVQDHAPLKDFARLTNQVSKNLFRLESDQPPAVFEPAAARRAKLGLEALRASALARLSVDPEEQRRRLGRALELEPDYLEARLVLGKILLEEGEAREAIHVLAASKVDGAIYREAYFDLGLAYLEVGDPESGLEIFGNLTEIDASRAVYFNNAGVALLRTGRPDEAIGAFRTAAKLNEDVPTYRFNLGWSYWRAGRGGHALELFESVTRARPFDAEAYLLHAAAATSQAKPDEAASSRAVAWSLDPELEDVDPTTVEGWERIVADEDAVRRTGLADALDEDVVAIFELLEARALRASGRLEEAIQVFQKMLYREPGDVETRRELVDLYRETGELEKAAAELSFLAWSEPSADTHVELARLYLYLKEPERAYEEVEKALELEPDHGEAQNLRDVVGEPLTPP